MICAIVKWMVSWAFDSERPIPSFARSHADRCAGCRRFVEFSLSLEAALVPDHIRAAAARESGVVYPSRSWLFGPLPAVSAAVCLIVLCLIGIRQFGGKPRLEISEAPATFEEFLEAADGTSLLASGSRAAEWYASADETMSIEIADVVSDVAAAGGSLLSALGME